MQGCNPRFSFYSAEGLVPATYAYLRLTDTDLDYNGQLLGDIKQNKGLFILFEIKKGNWLKNADCAIDCTKISVEIWGESEQALDIFSIYAGIKVCIIKVFD